MVALAEAVLVNTALLTSENQLTVLRHLRGNGRRIIAPAIEPSTTLACQVAQALDALDGDRKSVRNPDQRVHTYRAGYPRGHPISLGRPLY